MVTCTNDVILLGDTHCVAVLPDVTGYVTTFDACNDVIVTQDPLPGTNMPGPGEYFVTMTGFDGCNQSQCLLKVIVRCRTANDYDGDGVADLAVYEETTGDWYIYSVAWNDVFLAGGNWGWSATRPVAGDYDGDQVSDLSVFDAASGDWWAAAVTTNGLGSILLWYDNWGFPGCVAVPGDYDGDRVFDQAVYHEPSGNWWIKTVDGTILVWQLPWGSPGFSAVSGEE